MSSENNLPKSIRKMSRSVARHRGEPALRAPHAVALMASTALIAALAASPAGAQQVIIIDDAQTGPVVVDGVDRLTVTESGSISSVDNNAITVTNDSNVVDMHGALSTTGSGANGVFVDGNGNIITSSGPISAATDGFRIDGGTGNSITNSGPIIAGRDGFDIDSNGSRLTNFGAISAGTEGIEIDGTNNTVLNYGDLAAGGIGIWLEDSSADNTVTNFGIIMDGPDPINRGIQIDGSRNTVTNYGLIVTQGGSADGVQTRGGTNNNRFTNFGSIRTVGGAADGFEIRGSSHTITNSGSVVAANANAFDFLSGAQNITLRLLAPGFVGGAIDLSNGTNTTVEVVTGPSQSIFWTLLTDDPGDLTGDPNISGSVPWFYDAATQSVATFDPTLLAVETAALGDLTSLLSRLGLGALDGPDLAVDGSGGPLAYRPESDAAFVGGVYAADPVMLDQAMALEAVPDPLAGKGWATVFGGLTEHEGGETTIDADTAHLGFAAGYTWQQTPGLTLNAMAGYAYGAWSGDSAWSPSFDHDTHTGFAGLHGEQALDWSQFGEAEVRFGVTAGYIAVDHSRLVNDNLAPLGESWVGADYGGFFVSPEIAVSTDIAMANDVTLTPSAGLRYAALWLGGYTEAGAVTPAANATVEARMIGMVEARAELAAARQLDWGSVSGRIGYLGRFNAGDDATGITLNTVTEDVGAGFEALNALYVGGGARRPMGAAGFVALDGQVMLGDTARGVSGSLTVGMTF